MFKAVLYKLLELKAGLEMVDVMEALIFSSKEGSGADISSTTDSPTKDFESDSFSVF
jgi:hypothetical protein